MQLRRQYDYFDTIDGAQGLIYTVGENGRKTERGEIISLTVNGGRSVETINMLGQDVPGKKPGLPEFTASMTYYMGLEQSQWFRLLVSPPREGGSRRNRVERFQILGFIHDREVPHALTQKVILNECWVSQITAPLAAVNDRILQGSAEIQIEWVDFIDHFAELESGVRGPAPNPLILG
ncbi:MAG: hypothetical protein FWG64_13065 [Firmicutes bacterium]|nr:hypothetical protein [Bacillota bacterium]